MIEHVHVRYLLSEYLEDELLASERQTVECHLKVCPVCRQELQMLRQIGDTLQQLPPEITPADFMDKLKVRLEQHDIKLQSVTEPVSASSPRAELTSWVLRLRQFLFLPLPARILLYIAIPVLSLTTVQWRMSPEQTTAAQGVVTAPAPAPWKVSPQTSATFAGEKIQAIGTTERTLQEPLLSITPSLLTPEVQNKVPALVWRVAGSEPEILRKQVKTLANERVGAIVVQEAERLLVISLPTSRLPVLRQELKTLGAALSDATLVPATPTTVVHINFVRSPSVASPMSLKQLPNPS